MDELQLITKPLSVRQIHYSKTVCRFHQSPIITTFSLRPTSKMS